MALYSKRLARFACSYMLFFGLVIIALAGCDRQHDKPLAESDKSQHQRESTDSDDAASAKKSQPPATGELAVLDISERSKDGRNAIAVTFSSAIDSSKNLQSYFTVTQAGEGIVEGGWVVDKNNKIAWFDHTQPETSYTVTVNPGLPAKNGSRLASAESQDITTRSINPSATFNTQGAFISDVKKAGLPVASVNINEVDIDFFRVNDKDLNTFIDTISNNYYGWWSVEQLTRFATLAHSGRYALEGEKNKRTERVIPIADEKALREPGVYLAVMLPAGEYDRKQVIWFSVTDIGLHIRQYDTRMDVYAASLTTGKALPNIHIRLIDENNTSIIESKTTPEGLASFAGAHPKASLLTAQDNKSFSLIDLKKPALDLSEFDLGSRPQLPMEFFVYTPRDLFRPGESVDFNGLLRSGDGKLGNTPALNVEIKRPNGSVARAFKWLPEKAGYYHHAWQIPKDAPVGNWELVASGILQSPVVYPFKVEEFLPERLKLEFNSGKEAPAQFDAKASIAMPVQAEYLYGAPASGNRLSAQVRVSPWREVFDSLPGFEFGDINELSHNQNFDLKDTKLDSEGKTVLKLKSRWQNTQSPLRLRFTASVYESGGRPVSRATSALVWPGESIIGIRPEFGDNNPEQNSRAAFEVLNANAKGELLAADNLDVQLIREDRQYFWVYSDARGWHWDWSEKEFSVAGQSLTLKAGEKARLEFPVEWGNYRLQIKNLAANTQSSVRFYAGHNWYQDWQQAQQGAGAARPTQVTMALDKASYRAGDIAKLKIVPPEAGEALVLVEGDGPLWSKRIHLSKNGASLDIPIDVSWQQHNLYVTTLLLQATDDTKKLTQKRSFGLVHLPLDRTARQLSIEIDAAEKIQPNSELKAKVVLSGAQTSKGTRYLTLAAVDVGVLNISDFETPDPFDYFFAQRRYAPRVQDLYHKVIENSSAPRARMRFGGDTDLARGGKEPQSQVQIVSLFSGLVEVNSSGEAEVVLQIPDFNGRLRLMVVGFSDNAFGKADTEVTVAAPVVTQIAMPRFLAMGDRSTLALDLQNMSDSKKHLRIAMTSTGPVTIKTSGQARDEQSIILQAKEKRTLSYQLDAVGYTGAAKILLDVSEVDEAARASTSEPLAFTRSWKLGVRPAYPALVEQKNQWLKTGEIFSVDNDALAEVLPNTLEALLSVSTVPNMNIQAQLQNLIAYPYGCLEQTSSRAFPLTYATRENQARFNLTVVGDDERLKMIEQGVERLASMQQGDGGFGLWYRSSPEEHWLSVYVVDFLLSAKDQGIVVPESVLTQALGRLTQYVNHGGSFIHQRWTQDNAHYTFAYKAYAAYVLSRLNQAPLGTMRSLYDKNINDAKSGLPQVHLGLALINMGDKKRGLAAIDMGIKNVPERELYLGDYGSRVRDLAMIIYLLTTADVRVDEAFELSQELARAIRDKRWFSTQERSALFLAGIALETTANTPWQASLTFGGGTKVIAGKNSYREYFSAGQATQGFSLRSDYDKSLFVTLETSGYTRQAPEPVSKVLDIRRQWYSKDGKATSLDKVEVGELYLAHLRVSAKTRIPDALVVDLLPAGLELENQNLEHAIKLDDVKIEGETIAKLKQRSQIKYEEYRDDRYVAALDVGEYQATDVFYLVRAVTPGEYKIPTPFVEDMYSPERHAIGASEKDLRVVNPVIAK